MSYSKGTESVMKPIEDETENSEGSLFTPLEEQVKNDDLEKGQPSSVPFSHSLQSFVSRAFQFYSNNEFLLLVVMSIVVARLYPPLGAVYVQPGITATWVGVVFIFIIVGLTLRTEEFKKAFGRFRYNATVQFFSFFVISFIVFIVSRALLPLIGHTLADGMVIGSCLPMAITVNLVLTRSSGGDEASAIFNSAFANMIGIFLSPVLILAYLGVTAEVDIVGVFTKLIIKVLLPLSVGQVLRNADTPVVAFVKKNKKYFKRFQQYCLIFIVYCVFCRTFTNKTDAGLKQFLIMGVFEGSLLISIMGLSWYMLKVCFPTEPTLRVAGLFACTHKTVVMGVPLINAMYEGSPSAGMYTLPLLIWHPLQLLLGSFLAPTLEAFVAAEKKRLGLVDLDLESDALVVTKQVDDGSDREAGGQDHKPQSKEYGSISTQTA